jgi:hypothetical protein
MATKGLVTKIPQIGLSAKGLVYLVIGTMAFLAAFEIGGQSEGAASKTGAFEFVRDKGGNFLLLLLAAGLFCYVAWRLMQAFSRSDKIKTAKRIRYFFSALTYGAVAYSAVAMITRGKKSGGDQNQQAAADIMDKPMGEWLVGAAALVLAGIGIYQIYYALSEKYKKHVQELDLGSDVSGLLLRAGKVGYIARGLVWLLLAYLLGRAAFSHNPSQAGDTGKAFRFIEDGYLGSYLLGGIGLGVIAYGIFCFVRARYERF